MYEEHLPSGVDRIEQGFVLLIALVLHSEKLSGQTYNVLAV